MTHTSLSTLVKLRRGASYKSALLGSDGLPLLGLGTIRKHGGFKGDNLRRYAGESPDRMRVRAGDLYVSLKDMTQEAALLGAVARVPNDIETARLTQDTIALDLIAPDAVDPAYLYWQLRTPTYREYCRSRGTGTTNLDLSQENFLAFEIPLPTIDEQRRIVSVLGALDDKIAANQRVATLLDRSIDALFQYSEMKSRQGTNAQLRDMVSITRGVSYRSPDLAPSRTALVSLKSIDRSGKYQERGLKDYIGPYKPEQIVYPGEIVIAQTDLTQSAEVVGQAVRVPESRNHESLVASLDLAIIRPTDRIDPHYLLGVLRRPEFRAHCRSHVTGTTVLHLSSEAIPNYAFNCSPCDAQAEYASQVAPMYARADAIGVENERLAATRDELLPLLMSGMITVKDAEKHVEESA